MSSALAIDPIRSLQPRPATPRPLRPVDVDPAPAGAVAPAARRAARPRVLAASVVLGGVVCVVAAQLLLSIGTANGAYRLHALEQRSDLLTRQAQVQSEAIRALAAPQRLAAQAAALGMVPDDSPAYLDARTGQVLGSRSAATGAVHTPGGLTR
ncbi:hypothetical protein [uncultured Amnibacterium sp.]|uniref:hypothetical protein n=1 Tax=uncultured Amnibacterium sp. TaxID=1631851 RepID=UPI0035CBE941